MAVVVLILVFLAAVVAAIVLIVIVVVAVALILLVVVDFRGRARPCVGRAAALGGLGRGLRSIWWDGLVGLANNVAYHAN